MFAKRHFEAIATVMQDADPLHVKRTNARVQHEQTIRALADLFASDNGSFQRDRFIAACRPGANVRARASESLDVDELVKTMKAVGIPTVVIDE
jgi:hypothetical protein